MEFTGKKIFYDKTTGIVLFDSGERTEYFSLPAERYFEIYPELRSLNISEVGILELEYGQYLQDFAESVGFRVNPETKTLEFSYPDPNAPEEPPVFQRPLTEQIAELTQRQVTMNRTIEETSTTQQGLLELLMDLEVI